MAGRWVDEPVPCFDPECPGMAEPESDGDLRYYSCPECGYESGYEQARQAADSVCAAGVPEEVRRRASIAPKQDPQPVFLGTIGRRPQ